MPQIPSHAWLLTAAWLSAFTLPGCGAFAPPPGDPEPPPTEMGAPEDMAPETPDDGGPTRRAIGEPCSSPVECVDGAGCVSAGDSFLCMASCDEPGGLCPGGEVCTALGSGARVNAVCYLGGGKPPGSICTSNLECAAGHLCFGVEQKKYCLRACTQQGPQTCQDDQMCVVNSQGKGYCRDIIGAPCGQRCLAQGGICSEELGASRLDLLYPEGFCTRRCQDDAECPGEAACRVVSDDPEQRACLGRCVGDAECRFNEGERCRGGAACAQTQAPARCEALAGSDQICL